MTYTTVPVQISLDEINRALARPVPPRPGGHRSKGTHLTDILQRMNRESGRMKEKVVFGRNTFEPLDEDNMPICMFAGMCVESMLLRMYPWLEQVGEVSSDGIAMSPDAVEFDSRRHLLSPEQDVTLLHEFKATWKSSRHLLEEYFNYLQQIKSYCKGIGTLYAVLWIFHVMGDYRFGDGDGPCLLQHHIKFTPWELESSWAEVVRRKQEYGL
jgi:hypothetical protein